MSDTGVIENMRDFSESKSDQVHIMKEDFIEWRNHFGAMLYFCQRIVGKERFSIPDLRNFEEIRFHEHQGYVKNRSFPVASYIARIESQAAEIAELIDCLKDMEKGDDGHAWKVARRLIEKYGEKK